VERDLRTESRKVEGIRRNLLSEKGESVEKVKIFASVVDVEREL
jgi:hypothetical protein